MSRFLTIQLRDDGSAIVRGRDTLAPHVAEFRRASDALQFCTAVALSANNPDARAEEGDRLQLYTVSLPDGPNDDPWFVFPHTHSARPVPDDVVAKIASPEDAVMFVQFMRP